MEPGAGSAAGQAPGGPLAETPAGGTGQPSPVEWTVSPWRQNRAGAIATALIALGLWLVVIRLLPGERLTAIFLGLVLLISLAPGMASMHCRVDEEGAARRILLAWERRRWTDIRRARLGERGLFVSPLARPGPLDRFRGMFLPIPRQLPGAEELRDGVRAALERHGL